MRFKVALIIALFMSHLVPAQDTDTEMALYNIGLGGIVGGIGASLNKKKEESFGKTFLAGFLKGGIG